MLRQLIAKIFFLFVSKAKIILKVKRKLCINELFIIVRLEICDKSVILKSKNRF